MKKISMKFVSESKMCQLYLSTISSKRTFNPDPLPAVASKRRSLRSLVTAHSARRSFSRSSFSACRASTRMFLCESVVSLSLLCSDGGEKEVRVVGREEGRKGGREGGRWEGMEDDR